MVNHLSPMTQVQAAITPAPSRIHRKPRAEGVSRQLKTADLYPLCRRGQCTQNPLE